MEKMQRILGSLARDGFTLGWKMDDERFRALFPGENQAKV
jgi:hypothetical protein